jgi:ABC-2 type transport system permease protein
MRGAAAIASRELRAYFLTPGGYVVAALYMLVNGWLFVRGVLVAGEPATMRPVFAFSMVAFIVVCPALTMRSVSEELRLGTIEVLFTSPLRSGEVILGKFLAALAFLAILVAPTAIFVAALETWGRPDYGEVLCGYLGVLLAGSAYLASGILASTLTASQVVAYLVCVFFWLITLLATKGLPVADVLPAAWKPALDDVLLASDPDRRLRDFAIGLLDTANLVYFVSLTAVMLVFSVALLEARRWR